MKIEALKLRDLRNDEHFEFFTEFIDLVNKAGVEKLRVVNRFIAFTTVFAEEDEALKKIAKSDLTRLIHEADVARDTVFRGLAGANHTMLKHFKPDVREAAIRLQIIFDTYGNVALQSIDAESSAIQNLLGELTQRHAADMTTAGLNDWAEELRVRNMLVRNLMAKRNDETASRTSAALREVRGQVDEAYRRLADLINALALIDAEGINDDGGDTIPPGELRAAGNTSPYADFISRLNTVIKRYNNSLAIRRGKAAAKNNPPAPENPVGTL